MNHPKWLLLGALALSACRDLKYPEGDEAVNLPPEVAFLSPAPGEVVTLSPIISLDVRDPNGIADVTLYCGGVPIFVWTAPPYLGNVDLGSCAGSTNAQGEKEILIRAVARDLLGLSTTPGPEVLVKVNLTVAQLTVTAPGRAAPNGRLELRIQSNRPLGAFPSVRIGSLVAVVSQRGATLTDFDAVFDPLPGLGTDLYDGGTEEIPLEVLEEVERPLLVEVEGHATSGNVTRVVLQVLLSRIAWMRALPVSYPGPNFSWATAFPAATDRGLVIPAPRNPQNPGSSEWLPIRMDRVDGRFVPFNQNAIRDGGFAPNEMDALGRIVMSGFDEVGNQQYLYVDPATGEELTSGAYPASGLSPLFRVGEVLCTSRDDAGFCSGTTERSITCLSPAGPLASPIATATSDFTFGTGFSGEASGDTVAVTGYNACGTEPSPILLANAVTPSAVTVLPHLLVGTTLGDASIRRLVPLSDGTFAASLQIVSRNLVETWVLNPNGTRGGAFLAGEAATRFGTSPQAGVDPQFILSAGAGGSLVTLRNNLHLTVLEQWFPGESTPRGTIRLLGYYRPAAEPDRLENVVLGGDGSLTVQLVTANNPGSTGKPSGGDLILGIDPQFRARWLYRPDAFSTGGLFGNRTSPVVYYLDTGGQRVTALAR
ncbi:MAG: Ig-like domain-containing protein [Myxococcota bacterium]|nr:Ig-like domain-containing protein [Myxococcota bacterium]